MLRTMLTSKIHRATVTQADLHHVGPVTVDQDLLDAADLLAVEKVDVVDVTNGAAARLVHHGDLVILISYGQMGDAEARSRPPKVVFVDADNRIVGTGHDPAEALPLSGLVRGDGVHVGSYDDDPTLVW